MTRPDSLILRHRSLVAAAVVATHASFVDEGFRQRDLRFMIELFSNWIESSPESRAQQVQNTQIQRHLQQLTGDGFLRRTNRSANPRYRLTRIGLLELSSQVIEPKGEVDMPRFLFVHMFIKSYAPKIQQLVEKEGVAFPSSLRIELTVLFDLSALIQKEMRFVDGEIRKLDDRISDAVSTSDLVRKQMRLGLPFSAVLQEVEAKFPYDLNSQKPLSELIAQVPAEMRQWELEEGNRLRASQLWSPYRKMLQGYRQELERLASR